MKKYIVITTINPESDGIARFKLIDDWNIILVGDKKSVPIESSGNVTFLSLQDQYDLGYQIVEVCPYNHYARKNIGYLYAIQNGADIIYDTDDDNLPYEVWHLPEFVSDRCCVAELKFLNIYKYFSDEIIWPRGYPLDEICRDVRLDIQETEPLNVGVWQGLADIEPDVDAIFRLVMNKTIKFKDNPPLAIGKGHYCPFNSQNTFWSKKTFPYLYLPATTSFRFTDILRGYIAQRLMWQHDLHLGFTKSTVYQERNEHNLMRDFKDEIECYLNIKPIVELLDSLVLTSEPLLNVEAAYTALSENGFAKSEELNICKAWITDLDYVMGSHPFRTKPQ